MNAQQQIQNNRIRLIEQNKRLRTEITKIKKDLNDVIMKRTELEVQNKNNEQLYRNKQKQLLNQQKYILKLKDKLHRLRSTVILGQHSIIKQQDKVTQMKKQIKKIEEQKQTLMKCYADKIRQIQFRNDPHDSEKSKIEHSTLQLRMQNKLLQDKLSKMEKQVRRQHEICVDYQQQSKQSKGSHLNNIEELIQNIDQQIKSTQQTIKAKELKWLPNAENLDTEYMKLLNIHQEKKSQAEKLQKKIKNWQIRTCTLRDDQEIKEFKQRLSKIIRKPKISISSKADQRSAIIWSLPPESQTQRNNANKSVLVDSTIPTISSITVKLNEGKNQKLVQAQKRRMQERIQPTNLLNKMKDKSLDPMNKDLRIKIYEVPIIPSKVSKR